MKITNITFNSLLFSILLFNLTACSNKSVSQANIHEHAVICFDCSYEQAVHYAIEEAHPTISCDSGNASAGLPTNNCRSEPRQIVVYDGLHHKTYGFTLQHNQQGLHRHQLVLQVLDREISPEVSKLLRTVAEARLQLQSEMNIIPAAVLQVIANENTVESAVMKNVQTGH